MAYKAMYYFICEWLLIILVLNVVDIYKDTKYGTLIVVNICIKFWQIFQGASTSAAYQFAFIFIQIINLQRKL